MPPNTPKKEPAKLRREQKNAERENRTKLMLCRILIVCEGEKTEPNYFKAFRIINNNIFTYEVEAIGDGLNTIGVVNKAIELRDKAQIPYDAVWAVFDKDGFPSEKFNSAILKAKDNNISVAWSNEAFELWYLLHFQYRNTFMSRDDYKKAISKEVNKSGRWKSKKPYVYKKNDKENYNIMSYYGNLNTAIKNAERLEKQFEGSNFHKHNPCTMVYKLVLQLLNKDKELINEVMRKIDFNHN